MSRTRLHAVMVTLTVATLAACEGTPTGPDETDPVEYAPPRMSVAEAVPSVDDVLDRVLPTLGGDAARRDALRQRIQSLRVSAQRGDELAVAADAVSARGALQIFQKYAPDAEPQEVSVVEIMIDQMAYLAGASLQP